jgi:hypothetical protein
MVWKNGDFQMPLLPSRIRNDDGSAVIPAAKLCQVPCLLSNHVQLDYPKRASLHIGQCPCRKGIRYPTVIVRWGNRSKAA